MQQQQQQKTCFCIEKQKPRTEKKKYKWLRQRSDLSLARLCVYEPCSTEEDLVSSYSSPSFLQLPKKQKHPTIINILL